MFASKLLKKMGKENLDFLYSFFRFVSNYTKNKIHVI